ncbi:MAG: hypothetical protein ABR509_06835 [Candidatus Limnocylindria bacterium]
MHLKRWSQFGALPATALLAACTSGIGSPSSGPAAPATGADNATPAGTPLGFAEAADAYVALTDECTAERDEAYAALLDVSDQSDLPAARNAYAALVSVERECFLAGLNAINFRAEIADAAEAARAARRNVIEVGERFADAQTVDAFNEVKADFNAALRESLTAATALRNVLGLPPPPRQ